MRVNLGCAENLRAGWVNVDLVPAPDVVAVDLRDPWPWPDGSVTEVLAEDIIEHLPDKIHTMNELWRVLAPGGLARIGVPTTDGPGAWQDPTHVSFWNRNSFNYFTVGGLEWQRFAQRYGIKAAFRVVWETWEDGPNGAKLTIVLEKPHAV